MNERLPDETTSHATMKSIWLTVAAVFALALLVNVFALVTVEPDPEINLGYWLVQKKWQILNELDEPVDWLILGDSSVNQGVIPEVWDERMGGNSVNLGTMGDALSVSDALMLEAYIERFGPPSNVLIVHVYDIWHRNMDELSLSQAPLTTAFSAALDDDDELTAIEVRSRTLLKRFVPLYFQDQTMPELFKQPWRLLRGIQKSSLPEMTSDGFMVMREANVENVTGDHSGHLEFVSSSQFTISAQNRRALERIAELVEAHSFDVYIANSPLYAPLYEDDRFQRYYSDVMGFLSDYASSSDRIHLLQTEAKTFPLELMQNADHVILESAEIYTRWLADEYQSYDARNAELTKSEANESSLRGNR